MAVQRLDRPPHQMHIRFQERTCNYQRGTCMLQGTVPICIKCVLASRAGNAAASCSFAPGAALPAVQVQECWMQRGQQHMQSDAQVRRNCVTHVGCRGHHTNSHATSAGQRAAVPWRASQAAPWNSKFNGVALACVCPLHNAAVLTASLRSVQCAAAAHACQRMHACPHNAALRWATRPAAACPPPLLLV